MRNFLKSLLLPVLVFLSVWAAVILWWQANRHLPDDRDIWLYLGTAPVGAILVFWLFKKSFDVIKWFAGGLRAAPVSAATRHSSEGSPKSAAESDGGYQLSLYGGALLLPQADSGQALLDVLREPKFDAIAHPELKNSLGAPVIATPVANLDADAVRSELQPLLDAQGIAEPAPLAVLRTLALASRVLDDVLKTFGNEFNQIAPSRLAVIVLLPSEWGNHWYKTTDLFLRQQLKNAHWPEEILLTSIVPVKAGHEALLKLDEMNLMLNRNQLDHWCVLLAADSMLDQVLIDTWEQTSQLYGAQTQKGLIPGEGAAAILFRRAGLPQPTDFAVVSNVYRAAFGTRKTSAGAPGEVSSQLLNELTDEAMQVAKKQPQQLSVLLADTDHRASRKNEAIDLISTKLATDKHAPENWSVGASMGYAGVAASLAALVSAHEFTAANKQPVICVAALDDFERGVVIVHSTDDLAAM